MIGFKTLPIKGLWRCLGLRLKDRKKETGRKGPLMFNRWRKRMRTNQRS